MPLEFCLKRNPAGAVYCRVLNLLSQVGPGTGIPPWLEPIASFLKDEAPKVSVGPKRRKQYHGHSRALSLYHDSESSGEGIINIRAS